MTEVRYEEIAEAMAAADNDALCSSRAYASAQNSMSSSPR